MPPAGLLDTNVPLAQNRIHVNGTLSFYGPEAGDTRARVENKAVFSWYQSDALILLKTSASKDLTIDVSFDYDVTGGRTWEHGTSSIGDKVRHKVSNFRYTVASRVGPQAVLSTREQTSGSFSFSVSPSKEAGQALLVDVMLVWTAAARPRPWGGGGRGPPRGRTHSVMRANHHFLTKEGTHGVTSKSHDV